MAGQRITVVAHFETLIAQAGFTKASLARAANVTRGVIFHAINPTAYDAVSGGLRETTAWKIAHAYAERADLDPARAFAQLFVITGESIHRNRAPQAVELASPVQRDPSDRVSPSAAQEPPAMPPAVPVKTAVLRLDAESLTMLDALMQDEDRSSQRDMLRVLIKRAYRALVARRSNPG